MILDPNNLAKKWLFPFWKPPENGVIKTNKNPDMLVNRDKIS